MQTIILTLNFDFWIFLKAGDLLEVKAPNNPYLIKFGNQQGKLFMQGYEGMAFSTGRIVFLKRTIPPQKQNCKPHHITQ